MAEPLPSRRTADEVMEQVIGRGRTLAMRRRVGAGLAVLLGTAMILPAGVLAIGGDGPATLAGTANSPTTTAAAPAAVVEVSTSQANDPPEVTPVVGEGSTQPASPRPVASAPPTTSRARPTVTTPPVTVGRPPAGPALPACSLSQLEVAARSLRPVYQLGEQVALSAFIVNASQRDCTYRRVAYRFSITRAGLTIFSVQTEGGGDEESVFLSGQAFAANPSWSRDRCPEGDCEPDSYAAVFSWSFDGGPAIEKSAPFRLAPPPTTTTSTTLTASEAL